MRLLAPLVEDLRAWRGASGAPAEDALVFPAADGERVVGGGVQVVGEPGVAGSQAPGRHARRARAGAFGRAASAAGVPEASPYTLRHSFCSLLLHEGRSVIYVARQMGHDAKLTLGTYGHVIDELEDAPRVPAEDAIRAARSKPVCHWCVTEGAA